MENYYGQKLGRDALGQYFLAMARLYGIVPLRDAFQIIREIVDEYMFGIKIELKGAEDIDRILFYFKPPRSNQEKRKFLKKIEPLTKAVCESVRAWRYRGHTMLEVPNCLE